MTKNFITGFVFFVLATVTSYYFYYQTTKSELTIVKEYPTSIIKKPYEFEDLKILYRSDTINSLSKLVLKIQNNSTSSIVESDFVRPLEILFNEDVKILKIEQESDHSKLIFENEEKNKKRNSIKLKFDLLNKEEEIILGIVYTGSLENIYTSTRISNITTISFKERKKENPFDWFKTLFGSIVLIYSLIITLRTFTNYINLGKDIRYIAKLKEEFSDSSESFLQFMYNQYNSKYIFEVFINNRLTLIELDNESSSTLEERFFKSTDLVINNLEQRRRSQFRYNLLASFISYFSSVYMFGFYFNFWS